MHGVNNVSEGLILIGKYLLMLSQMILYKVVSTPLILKVLREKGTIRFG